MIFITKNVAISKKSYLDPCKICMIIKNEKNHRKKLQQLWYIQDVTIISLSNT